MDQLFFTRKYILPFVVGGLALILTILSAVITGVDTTTDGLNGLIKSLSAKSSYIIDGIATLTPLGFAFVAGMIATVNPCGFAMLPAYLGIYIGSDEVNTTSGNPVQKFIRALTIGTIVTAGFVTLFGITGIILGAGARVILQYIPWTGLILGVILILLGSSLLTGVRIYSAVPSRVAIHIGNPNQINMKGYFLFGISYGIASLSCTLPIFLSVVGISLTASEIGSSIGQFVLYALGMGLMIITITLCMALFKETIVGFIRNTQRFARIVGAAFLIAAGCYIVYYWLTLGRNLL